MRIAESNLNSARELRRLGDHRSSANRSWYACYAAAHAIVASIEPDEIGGRGNLPNQRTPAAFRRAALRVVPKLRGHINAMHAMLQSTWERRVVADYKADDEVTRGDAGQSIVAAGSMVTFAGGVSR